MVFVFFIILINKLNLIDVMKKLILLPILSLFVLNTACSKKAEAPAESIPDTAKAVTDSSAVKTTPEFNKELKYENYSFKITTSGDMLTITPAGLEADNSPLTKKFTGKIANVEIGDINGDNKPEVFVYTAQGPDENGAIIGYSSNAGKSMSEVAVPELDDKTKMGYKGHDEYAMVENNLVQRFPLYDDKGNKTNKLRQIQYKLKDGEAMRKLVVDKVIEY